MSSKRQKSPEPKFQLFLAISLAFHLIAFGLALSYSPKTKRSAFKFSAVEVRLYSPKNFPLTAGAEKKKKTSAGKKAEIKPASKKARKVIPKKPLGKISKTSSEGKTEGEYNHKLVEQAISAIAKELACSKEKSEKQEWNELVGEMRADLEKWAYYERAKDVYARNWMVPKAVPQDPSLSVRVIITVDSTGKVVSYKVLKWSGNSTFDLSVQKLLKLVKQLPAPSWAKEEELVKIGFEFRPFTQKQ